MSTQRFCVPNYAIYTFWTSPRQVLMLSGVLVFIVTHSGRNVASTLPQHWGYIAHHVIECLARCCLQPLLVPCPHFRTRSCSSVDCWLRVPCRNHCVGGKAVHRTTGAGHVRCHRQGFVQPFVQLARCQSDVHAGRRPRGEKRSRTAAGFHSGHLWV